MLKGVNLDGSFYEKMLFVFLVKMSTNIFCCEALIPKFYLLKMKRKSILSLNFLMSPIRPLLTLLFFSLLAKNLRIYFMSNRNFPFCQAQPKSQSQLSWSEIAVLCESNLPPPTTYHPSGFEWSQICKILGFLSSREFSKPFPYPRGWPPHEDNFQMKTTSKWRQHQNEDNIKMVTTSKWRWPQNKNIL